MRNFLFVILADGQTLEKLPRSVERQERVIDRPDDPVGTHDLVNEIEVRQPEHAAWGDPDVAPL